MSLFEMREMRELRRYRQLELIPSLKSMSPYPIYSAIGCEVERSQRQDYVECVWLRDGWFEGAKPVE